MTATLQGFPHEGNEVSGKLYLEMEALSPRTEAQESGE